MTNYPESYSVREVKDAKNIAKKALKDMDLENVVKLGLPEVDDRYDVWRVPLVGQQSENRLGEIVIDAENSLIKEEDSTDKEILERRLLGRGEQKKENGSKKSSDEYVISNLRNTVGRGDCRKLINDMPAESVDLVFTSPPYYNAKPETTEYTNYEEYLSMIRTTIRETKRVLIDGKFFVMNTSPVLIRRTSRNDSSTRLAVPFDIHTIFMEEGFEFVDDIIWKKPEGAGWAMGRGRRFAADRNPMQYKPVPVTEYVLVYRKSSSKLIDYYINEHPNQEKVEESKIKDDYETTNIWEIAPANHSEHPAVFPKELAEKVIKYYSFKNDVVMDPFAGTGTVGEATIENDRRFVLFEQNDKYCNIIREKIVEKMGQKASNVNWINLEKPSLLQSKVGDF